MMKFKSLVSGPSRRSNSKSLKTVSCNKPSSSDLDAQYTQLLEDLAIPEAKRKQMIISESDDKKWGLIQAHRQMKENEPSNSSDATKTVDYWVSLISSRTKNAEPVITSEEAGELYAVLRTAHLGFLLDFIAKDGIEFLLHLTKWYTQRASKTKAEKKILTQILSCYKALLNTSVGIDGVLGTPGAVAAFALGMDLSNLSDLQAAREVVMLLAVLCFYSQDGRDTVVGAMDDLRRLWREEYRFQTLVDAFTNCMDSSFRAAAIMFLTTVVNSSADAESRIQVRNDLLALDILVAFDRAMQEAREDETDQESYNIIATQYEVFEDMMTADHKEAVYNLISGGSSDGTLDLTDQNDVFEYLYKQAQYAGCTANLLELTRYLLLIPNERFVAEPIWEGITQFTLEATDFSKRPGREVQMNFVLLKELLQKRAESDQKLGQVSSGDGIISKQKERIAKLESDLKTARSGKGGGSGEDNSEELQILKNQVVTMRNEIAVLQKQLTSANSGKPITDDRETAPAIPKSFSGTLDSTGLRPAGTVPGAETKGIPACPLPNMPGSLELAPIPTKSGSPSKINPRTKTAAATTTSTAPAGGNNGLAAMLSNRAQIAAVKAPAVAVAAFKDAGQARAEREEEIRKKLGLHMKKPIKPSCKMRNIFWTPVPVDKLEGTVWPELSDQKIKFSKVELESVFGVVADDKVKAPENENRKSTGKIHLVQGKRQQNVGITLSKIRASNEEIVDSIWTLDETLLTPEHVHVLLTAVPTEDEVELIQSFEKSNGNIERLAREDTFLRAISSIPNLAGRLQGIQVRNNFELDYERISVKAEAVLYACKEINSSDKIRKILEIVLALGNYINGGTPRGAVWGFKLEALQVLDTIKSQDGKSTLMDFLFQILEESYPDLVNFSLQFCHDAREVSLADTQQELNILATNVRNLKVMVEHTPENKKDAFQKKMAGFEVKAAKKVADLQKDFERARSDFQKLASQFAETGKAVEPENFFSKFINFEISLTRARNSVKEKREMQERKKQLAAEKKRLQSLRVKHADNDDGVFQQFAKANTGNAETIVEGFRNRNIRYTTDRSTSGSLTSQSPAIRKKKVKIGPDGKPVRKLGPDGKPVRKKKLKVGKDGKPIKKKSSLAKSGDYAIV